MTVKISALSHKKALVLALLGVVTALFISVASFAATSSTSTITINASSGLAGEFGFVVAQDASSTTTWFSDNDGDTVVITGGTNNFAVGDYILIDEDADGSAFTGQASFHTITAISGGVLTVSPDIPSGYSGSASVTEAVVYPGGVHSWTPALNSATSVTAGNHFIINLKGLTTSDSAFVEMITTNPNELVKNYTYLNRTIGIYVLCESTSSATCSASAPFNAVTDSGKFGEALDATGNDINATADILTLQNARQQFVLEGGHVYALTVEGGALFTIDTTGGAVGSGDSLSPSDQVGITAR